MLLFASSAGTDGVGVGDPPNGYVRGVLSPFQNHNPANLRTREGGVREKVGKMWRTFFHRRGNVGDRFLGFFSFDRNEEGDEVGEEGEGEVRSVEHYSSVGLLHHRDEGERACSRSSVLARGDHGYGEDQVELADLADRRAPTRPVSRVEEIHSCEGKRIKCRWRSHTSKA